MNEPTRQLSVQRDLLLALLAVVIAVAVLAGQLLDSGSARHFFGLPPRVSLAQMAPPPTIFARLAALRSATEAVDAAIVAGIEAGPEVPWGDHGLSNVAITREDIVFDEGLGRYVVALEEGARAILTFDPAIQQRLQSAVARVDEPAEAAVAVEPSTGRVLALVDDQSDSALPPGLATRSYAWAASTFKVITAAALLEHSEVNADTVTCYHGGGSGFTEDLLEENAALDTNCLSLTRAMAYSANVIFGRLADQNLSAETLTATGQRFAFNSVIPFEMEVDVSRLRLVDDDRLAFAMSAAGFMRSQMSPLHGALIQAAIANDGVMMVPTMVERIEDAAGDVVYEHFPVEWRRVASPEHAQQLRELQSDTCTSGTARAQFAQRPGWPADLSAYGKTGTLANRRLDNTIPEDVRLYSWFTGVVERGENEVAVSGLVVQGPQWYIKGAYLASEAALGYFGQ